MTSTVIRSVPRSVLSRAALKDAFDYPTHGGALASILVLTAFRVYASGLPFFGVVLHLLLWLALYKYAMEVLAATGAGRVESPDVLAHADSAVHRSHLWVQLAIILCALTAMELAPRLAPFLIALSALILPGALLALAVMQNLLAALNPLNWVVVALRVGPAYAALAAGAALVLTLQLNAAKLIEGMHPRILAVAAFYLLAHYLVLVLFRLFGIALAGCADQLGFKQDVTVLPKVQRDRERVLVREDIARARNTDDLRERAHTLAQVLRRGADEAVHREYRALLRQIGDHAALNEHSRVHASELCAQGLPGLAMALCREALDDDEHFALPDGADALQLFDLAERAGQHRFALQLADNYRRAHPKRRDGAQLMLRAAELLADRLADAEGARQRLESALSIAEQPGTIEKALKRLNAGLPVRHPPADPAARQAE